MRYLAVSATIQNIGDVAEWLKVPPQGLMVFGEEMRPVMLTTVVKGYAQVIVAVYVLHPCVKQKRLKLPLLF